MGELASLETKRLYLRQMKNSDASSLFTILSDDEVTKYLDIDSLTSIAQAENIIKLMNERFEKNEGNRWGIFLKKNNQLIGTCGYNSWIKDRGFRGEIGYDLSKKYWGRGYMTETLKKVISYGFQEMDLNRIEALVMIEGKRSKRLLEKLGFTKEGTLREYGYWKDIFWNVDVYSILKREWNSMEDTV